MLLRVVHAKLVECFNGSHHRAGCPVSQSVSGACLVSKCGNWSDFPVRCVQFDTADRFRLRQCYAVPPSAWFVLPVCSHWLITCEFGSSGITTVYSRQHRLLITSIDEGLRGRTFNIVAWGCAVCRQTRKCIAFSCVLYSIVLKSYAESKTYVSISYRNVNSRLEFRWLAALGRTRKRLRVCLNRTARHAMKSVRRVWFSLNTMLILWTPFVLLQALRAWTIKQLRIIAGKRLLECVVV